MDERESIKKEKLLIRYMMNELSYQRGRMQDIREWASYDRICDVISRVKKELGESK